jgi:hypothetical protein
VALASSEYDAEPSLEGFPLKAAEAEGGRIISIRSSSSFSLEELFPSLVTDSSWDLDPMERPEPEPPCEVTPLTTISNMI